MRAVVAMIIAAVGCAQTSRDPQAALAQARERLLDRAERIDNYMCVETVNRSYLKNSNARYRAASCDQIMGDKKAGRTRLELQATDRLRLDMKVSEGREIGAWAGAGRFDSRDVIDFIGGGPFGTGPLGTLIADIFANGAVRFTYGGEESLNGMSVFKYSYQVPVESSHYLVRTGTGWVTTGFRGDLWIDPVSFELRRLTSESSELAPETSACVADNDVVYDRTRIGARDFLLPQRSELHFVMRDGTETHSLTTYSGCREYHAESTVRFEDPALPDMSEAKTGASVARVLPAGLAVKLGLAAALDTDTAAAGDMLTAKVMEAVRGEKSKEIIIPAEATVRGRIVGLRHFLGSEAHFEITILPQSIDIRGIESPFYAVRDRSEEFAAARRALQPRGRGVPLLLPPRGKTLNVGTFYFPSSKGRVVVPRGYKSTWVTIAPPGEEEPALGYH